MKNRALRWTPAVIVFFLATLLTNCESGSLGFYLYPQAVDKGISEVREDGASGKLEVVGYLPSWKIGEVDPSQIRHLTDLVYFSLAANSSGGLVTRGLTAEHEEFLKSAKRQFGVRLILGITDHKRNGALSHIVASPTLRDRFAKTLAKYLADKGFDGADFDWEYPGDEQMPDYETLLRDVHKAFSGAGYRLSVAISPSHPLTVEGYDAVDRVHGMMYDDEGKHATLSNIMDHVETMIRQGVEPSKLLLGLPFYGRGYTSKGPKWSQAVSYKTLQERYNLLPSQDVVSGYYFNGIETIRQKVRYASAEGLSGIMVWEIGQDTNDSSSLLNAITEVRQDLNRLN